MEINKELVLSTAHIKYETSLALFAQTASTGDTNVPWGWRVWVEAEINGEYPELVELLALAKQHDCKWLILDQDAEIRPELTSFDW